MNLVEIKEEKDFSQFLEWYQEYQKVNIFPFLKDLKLIQYFKSQKHLDLLKELWKEDTLQQEPLKFCFFKNGEDILGFVLYRLFPNRQYSGWIYDIYLFPEFQHQGKGRVGLALVEQQMFVKKIEKIQCTCIPPWSQKFFSKYGYSYKGNSYLGYPIYEKLSDEI